MQTQNKKPKHNLSDSEIEASNKFLRFISIGKPSDQSVSILDRKNNYQQRKHEKITNGNLLVNVNKKHADNILKMISFHNLKRKAYHHKRFNTSKGAIKNRELSLAAPEEINTALRKQGVTNYRKIKKGAINKFRHIHIF